MDNEAIKESLRLYNYDMLEQIGSGGFSVCYKVFSEKYKQPFVAKVIQFSKEKYESRSSSYFNEVKALMHLNHPNVIKFYEYFQTEECFFLILEYCPGGNLYDIVKNQGPIPENNVREIMLKILDAMLYMESKGFAHLDIKPSNIFIDKNGRPKLADFGLSVMFGKDELCTEFRGSPAFISPEMIKHTPFNPFKADIWAIGVTVYILVTGEYPFDPSDSSKLRLAINTVTFQVPFWVSQQFRALINGAIVKNPTERITLADMIKILTKSDQEVHQEPNALHLSNTPVTRHKKSKLPLLPVLTSSKQLRTPMKSRSSYAALSLPCIIKTPIAKRRK